MRLQLVTPANASHFRTTRVRRSPELAATVAALTELHKLNANHFAYVGKLIVGLLEKSRERIQGEDGYSA